MTTTVSLTEMKVRELAQGVASGAFTPDEVIEASLARIAEVEDRVRAWSILDTAGARAQAEALTAEAKAGKLRGPLHGVPFGIKDEFHIAPRSALPPPAPIVVPVTLPPEYALTWSAAAAIGAEGATMHAGQPGQRATELLPATYYIQARRIRTWLTEMLTKLYADFDGLLMAVAPTPAPRGLSATGDASLLACWSYLGFPAITVNAGLSDENLPLGIQLVGAPKTDYALMRLGAWCEGVLGLLPPPVVGPMPA